MRELVSFWPLKVQESATFSQERTLMDEQLTPDTPAQASTDFEASFKIMYGRFSLIFVKLISS